MRWPGRNDETRVSDLRVEYVAGASCASALVGGERLWYTCDDTDLTAAPEAFGSWLLLPTLHRKRRLAIDMPVSQMWLRNMTTISGLWSKWWNYGPADIDVETRKDGERVGSDCALAFSCGVDSFHALHTGPKPDVLVAVQGFDIPLDDAARSSAYARSVEEIANEMGIRATNVRTNLRKHHSAGRPWLWERSHGGALASIAHVLGNRIGRFGIASTYSQRNQHAWGSTVDTDPLFSSDRVAVEHVGADDRREIKIRGLADNPVAQRHLRVCWENLSKSGNCSRCGKCLATMLLLVELGALDNFPVFTGTSSLPSALDALPYLKTQINIIDRLVNRGTLPSNVAGAARRLVIRSRRVARLRELRGYVTHRVSND